MANKDESATLPIWPDAGRMLGIGRNSAYQAARDGTLPTLRFGKRIVVPKAALMRLLQCEDLSAAMVKRLTSM